MADPAAPRRVLDRSGVAQTRPVTARCWFGRAMSTLSNWRMSIGHFQSQPGGPIFAGLRRAFGEPGRTKPAAERTGYAGVDQADRQSAGAQPLAPNLSLASPNVRAAAEPTPRPGGIAGDLARRGRAGSDWTIRLAANRAIAPNSLTGVSLLLGLCAAAWLSGGTGQDDVRGLITTGTWVVMRAAATRLSSATARRAGRGGQVGRGRQLQPDRSDWMVLPGFDWSGEEPPKRPGVGRPGFRQPHLRQPHLRQHSTGLARERDRRVDRGDPARLRFRRCLGWLPQEEDHQGLRHASRAHLPAHRRPRTA